jgi:hypothetical protein
MPCIWHQSAGFKITQGVASRQEDRLVGRVGIGYAPAGHAPMIAIQVGHGHIEHDQIGQPRPCQGRHQLASGSQLVGFPAEAPADIEGLHGPAGRQQVP